MATPKRPKRPRDPNSLAFRLVQESTGEAERPQVDPDAEQDPRRDELTPEEAETGLRVPPFAPMWRRLRSNKTIGDFATVNRGIRWRPVPNTDPQSNEYRAIYHDRYTRRTPAPGFARGVAETKNVSSFVLPTLEFLSIRPDDQYNRIYQLDWSRPKVALNAMRFARYDWRIAAVPDNDGLVFSQRFLVVWPTAPWTPNSLAAVLNNPIAEAFIAAHDPGKDITAHTIAQVPLPQLADSEISELDRLVEGYKERLSGDRPALSETDAEQWLLRIDAAVLKGYRLAPRMERELLDSFKGKKRRVVHPFGPYYPESMKAFIPLATYISERYKRSTAADFLAHVPKIEAPELLEQLTEQD